MNEEKERKECRFCLGSDRENELISPCLCNGSSRYVHRDCLNNWRERNAQAYHVCSTCQYEYRISRIWWGKVLTNPLTSILVSVGGLAGLGFGLGYGSSVGYNMLYYWFHHMPYHYPHRLQVLFHSMTWVGVPGLFLALGSCIRNMRDIPRVPPAEHSYFHPTYFHTTNYVNPVRVEKEEDDKQEGTQRAPYESKSCFLWLMLFGGVVSSFYCSYKWVYKHCLRWGAKAQEMVENI